MRDMIFYWLVCREIPGINGSMSMVHVLVFFISISTGPLQPGPDNHGSMVEWVVYGAPSAEKARAWAQVQYDKMHAKDSVPQRSENSWFFP
jgi:hypothetical protein